jgi:hypothetical protein
MRTIDPSFGGGVLDHIGEQVAQRLGEDARESARMNARATSS